jgi:hypothetical protein
MTAICDSRPFGIDVRHPLRIAALAPQFGGERPFHSHAEVLESPEAGFPRGLKIKRLKGGGLCEGFEDLGAERIGDRLSRLTRLQQQETDFRQRGQPVMRLRLPKVRGKFVG